MLSSSMRERPSVRRHRAVSCADYLMSSPPYRDTVKASAIRLRELFDELGIPPRRYGEWDEYHVTAQRLNRDLALQILSLLELECSELAGPSRSETSAPPRTPSEILDLAGRWGEWSLAHVSWRGSHDDAAAALPATAWHIEGLHDNTEWFVRLPQGRP